MISSSDILDRCIMQILEKEQNSIMKSRSLTASIDFAHILENPSKFVVCSRSILKLVPASAAEPRGL